MGQPTVVSIDRWSIVSLRFNSTIEIVWRS